MRRISLVHRVEGLRALYRQRGIGALDRVGRVRALDRERRLAAVRGVGGLCTLGVLRRLDRVGRLAALRPFPVVGARVALDGDGAAGGAVWITRLSSWLSPLRPPAFGRTSSGPPPRRAPLPAWAAM